MVWPGHDARHPARSAARSQVEKNTIHDSYGRGVQGDGLRRFTVNQNIVLRAGRAGVNIGNPDLNDHSRNIDGEVNGNTVHDTDSGIVLGAATRIESTRNRISTFGGPGETRGLYYGYLADSRLYENSIANTDGATYSVRGRPGSSNPGTLVWRNETDSTHTV